MTATDISLVNFKISIQAWSEIDQIRAAYDEKYLDKADVLMIAWGTTMLHDGRSWDGIIVGFYSKSETKFIESAIQIVDGRESIFFVNNDTKDVFAGKTVYFNIEKGFYLA